jgi:hypothetical protein
LNWSYTAQPRRTRAAFRRTFCGDAHEIANVEAEYLKTGLHRGVIFDRFFSHMAKAESSHLILSVILQVYSHRDSLSENPIRTWATRPCSSWSFYEKGESGLVPNEILVTLD